MTSGVSTKLVGQEQTNDGKIVHEAQILDSKIGDPRLELNTS